MKRNSQTWIMIAAAVVLGTAAGCSSDHNGPTAASPVGGATHQFNLDAPNGGLTNSNELPAFGDASIVQAASAEQPATDTVSSDPVVVGWAARPTTNYYVLTALWGHLESTAPVTPDVGGNGAVGGGSGVVGGGASTTMDWSGGVTVSQGAVVLGAMIAFDSNDHIVRPRANRRVLDWVSATADGYAGVRVDILDPDESITAADSLVFTAGAFTRTFAVSDLADLDEVFVVDASGDEVHLSAFASTPGSTERGFMRGQWSTLAPVSATSTEETGVIKGVWLNQSGTLAGSVLGVYGINENGQKIFYAKRIDANGVFQEFISGEWGQTATGLGGAEMIGWFRGTMSSGATAGGGMVQGHWRTQSGTAGYFAGRWCLDCQFSASNDR